MRCKYCGEEIQEDYLFCLSCGKPTEDTIKEYEALKNKKQETRSIEYFEIEQEVENNEEYDFSRFLYDTDEEELDEIEFSTEEEDIQEPKKEPMHNGDINKNDNLDNTQEIKFGRSDFKLSDEIKKNKKRQSHKFGNSTKREPRREENHQKRQQIYQGEQQGGNVKRKSRFAKRIRNFLYNILAGIGLWYLFDVIREPALSFIANTMGISAIYDIGNIKFASIAILLILIFLFVPFFICKGDAKVPLFFGSLLISWTIIGWVILMVVAISSNVKFKRVY